MNITIDFFIFLWIKNPQLEKWGVGLTVFRFGAGDGENHFLIGKIFYLTLLLQNWRIYYYRKIQMIQLGL